MGMNMYRDGLHFMGGLHWVWWLFWIVLIGLVAYYGWGRPSARQGGSNETPLEVLKRRLANGEVTTEEYEQRKALLDRDATPKR